MAKTTITIPVEMIPELEAWGKTTARLFGRLRGYVGVTPKDTPKDQDWYWSKRWQQWELQADEDIARGRVEGFDRVDDLLADLDT